MERFFHRRPATLELRGASPVLQGKCINGAVQTLNLATELFMVTLGTIDKSKGDIYGLKVGMKMQKGICCMYQVVLTDESNSFYLHFLH